LVKGAIVKLTTPEFEATAESLISLLDEMAQNQDIIPEIVEEVPIIFRPSFYHTECNLAERIQRLLKIPLLVDVNRVENWLERCTQDRHLQLSNQQKQAVIGAAQHRLMILTGGPGTGKTFTTRTIVALWKAMGKKIALAAPTGRAAQRLGEMTGMEAKITELIAMPPASGKETIRGGDRSQV
jgi:exodeoxyribonuclease V alpha subunit